MRIIHDVDAPMCPGAAFDGFRLKLHAFTDSPKNHPDLPPQMFDDEAIEIEGDPQYIIPMLESWIKSIKSVMAVKGAGGGK